MVLIFQFYSGRACQFQAAASSHTHVLQKKNSRKSKQICRFRIPFFPLQRIMVLTPLTSNDNRFEPSLVLTNSIRKYFDESSSTLAFSNMSFQQFLAELNTNLTDYILAIRRTTLDNTKVLLKRNVRDILTNNYNARTFALHRANMDIQYITDCRCS